MKATHLPTLAHRECLTTVDAEREIHHLCFDVAHGDSHIDYRPGDCLAIFPQNQKKTVAALCDALIDGAGEPLIFEGKLGRELPIGEFLLHGANLQSCSPSLVCAIEAHLPKSSSEKEILTRLCRDASQRSLLVQYCRSKTPLQLLQRYSGVLPAQQLCDHLQPLLPRLYSIASAAEWVTGAIDLTVSYVEIAGEPPRQGVCSHWLCRDLELGGETRAYHHHHPSFHLPESSEASLIMIGAGTGIAPFRAFLQERLLTGARGSNWLLAGQRNRLADFLYRDFLQTLAESGQLRLNVAFSRDQEDKQYVTHLMQQNAKDLVWQLANGAYLYVCGSIALGKSTQEVLLQILQSENSWNSVQAGEYVRAMRKSGRYRRDVY